jgi:hypothetical protein
MRYAMIVLSCFVALNLTAGVRARQADVPKSRAAAQAPITALAYRPDGKVLAVGQYSEVLLLDPEQNEIISRLGRQAGKVTGVAYSPDGQVLAVAASEPGKVGEVRLYRPATQNTAGAPEKVLTGHKDAILDLAFSPNGKLLATAGYDRLIKVWDVASGKELRTLKDHSDAVYGVSFSPDSLLLASGSADRAVKIWDVNTGGRLLTLSESTDWVYTVAWSPDGQHVVAAGVDKSIRVWQITRDSARIVQSAFGHEAAVIRLVYAADGRTLYSVGEDRVTKSWDTARLLERKVYDRQSDTVLALAVRGDQRQIALGRFDGAVVLLDTATGKITSQPVPVKPKPPQLARLSPSSGQRGHTVRVTLEGKQLDNVQAVLAISPGVATLIPEGRTPNQVTADVLFPVNTPAGSYPLRVKTEGGESVLLPFFVDPFPSVQEVEPNDTLATSQLVKPPVSIVGAIGKPGNVDYYRFEAPGGQEIGVQALTGAIGSQLDPVLQVTDKSGQVLAEGHKGVLAYQCNNSGTFYLSIRDREYRGGLAKWHYRLHVGNLRIVSSVFPLGLQRGTETTVYLTGVNLEGKKSIRVEAAKDAVPGSRIALPFQSSDDRPLGDMDVVIGEYPEVLSEGPQSAQPRDLLVPGTGNGRLFNEGTNDWRFQAKKGQPLIVEVNARRLGSPLDSVIEILDAGGKPVPRAVLRSVAKTYVVFRDHDSAGAGIRIEAWSEFAMNDYVWVGNELLRIRDLPKNPDDDCQFFSIGGQRIGYLDTTPAFLALGLPMYKVGIHPPGATFPPNGFPVIQLNYRNDDGGPGYGKDSRLTFEPPADGEYRVRIGDARGKGGANYGYRLTIRPPRPDFKISFNPTAPSVWKGGAVPVTVSAERTDGFEGQIAAHLANLPAGFSAPDTTIPAGENNTAFSLWADASAKNPAGGNPLKLIARATINGQEIVREATGGLPAVKEPEDLATTTEQSEVSVRPGEQVWLTAKIERRNGFTGRVPLDVRGLPRGVRVLDIGLNGILITEKESSRTFAIYAEPWVEPTSHPFVVLAQREGKGAEHAAKSVLLKVVPAKK